VQARQGGIRFAINRSEARACEHPYSRNRGVGLLDPFAQRLQEANATIEEANATIARVRVLARNRGVGLLDPFAQRLQASDHCRIVIRPQVGFMPPADRIRVTMDPKSRTAFVGPRRKVPRRPQKRFALLFCCGPQLGKEQGQGLLMSGNEHGHAWYPTRWNSVGYGTRTRSYPTSVQIVGYPLLDMPHCQSRVDGASEIEVSVSGAARC